MSTAGYDKPTVVRFKEQGSLDYIHVFPKSDSQIPFYLDDPVRKESDFCMVGIVTK
jgi:hypothetical protein